MAMPVPGRRRRRRTSESAATAGTASVTRIRAPQGAMVGRYLLPGTRKNEMIAVTAAAQVIFGGSVAATVKRAPQESWQKEAWDLRREIGEFRFSGDRVARAVSQLRLFVARLPDTPDGEPVPVTDGPVADIAAQLFGDQAAVQQELRRAAQHLQFNGESNLLVRNDKSGKLMWTAHSVQEITGQGESMKLDDGVDQTPLTQDDMVVRCWTPDPERGGLADSAARSVLPVARELKGLTEHTSAQIDSRLAGAGLLILPDSVEVLSGQASVPEEGDDDADIDAFVRALVESMTVPLSKRDSAASVVPLVIKVPASAVKDIQHLTFSTPFDAMAKDMREEAIRRIGLGMDSDPSVLLGQGSGNHWSAWLVSEEEGKLVVSPLGATICHALTTGVLRPILESPDDLLPEGDRPDQYQVWFDASPLELRPDKSADARALHDAMLLSDDANRRENGFDKADAPGAAELATRLLVKLLMAKPDFASAILPALGITAGVPDAPDPAAPDVGAAPAPPADPAPQGTDGQDRNLPDTLGDPPPASTPGVDAAP